MSTDTTQSQINEVRDQLSLDHADGAFLDVVAANLGMTRPPIGFSDDVWRAVVKAVALQYKQVKDRFHKVLEVLIGPQVTQCTGISSAVVAGDNKTLVLHDLSGIPQVGVVVLDEGTANEETIDYCYVDYGEDQRMYLLTEVAFNHAATGNDAELAVFSTVFASATTLEVARAFELPTEFPYTAVIGRGTVNEEVVQVTNIIGTTVTVGAPLANDHVGYTPSDIKTTLTQDYFATANFIVVDDTTQFPPTGWVALRGATDELVEYIDVDYTTNHVVLLDALANSFTSGSEVELLDTNETIKVATVQIKGKGWDVYQVTPRRVDIFLPDEVKDENTVLSASYLHTALLSPSSTTTTASASVGDLVLAVASTAGYPTAGVLNVGAGTDYVGFYVVDGTNFGIPNGMNVAVPIGSSVTLYEPVYPGTSLLIGNQWTTDHTWSGPYVYDNVNNIAEIVETTLVAPLSGPVGIVISQQAFGEALEIEDASAMPTTLPFTLRVGYQTSRQEDILVLDVFFRETFSSLIAANASPGATTISITALTDLPQNGGFRLLIDNGGPNEQVVFVDDYVVSTGVATLAFPTTVAVSIGDTVELLADVLEVDPLTKFHEGYLPTSQRILRWPIVTQWSKQETCAPAYSTIDVNIATFFPADGETIILNHGKTYLDSETALTVAAPSGTLILSCVDTSDFPTTYPYWVSIGHGGAHQRFVKVVLNNTGTNQLTISPGVSQDYIIGDKVAIVSGDPEVIEYDSKSGNTLVFDSPVVVQSTHWTGEPVNVSSTISIPSTDGFDWPLRMPVDILQRLQFIIDLIRAAGVQVNIINQR